MNRDIASAMKSSGYYQQIMHSSSELNRLKKFLSLLSEDKESSCGLQRPEMPCFPGLESHPFLNPDDYEAVEMLESGFEMITDEVSRLNVSDFLTYYPRGLPQKEMTTRPDGDSGLWKMFLFRYMAATVNQFVSRCPQTSALINRLPEFCGDYPWGDALLSLHSPGTHLAAHCSVDNLRVRIHLGLDIPTGSEIRVGGEVKNWQKGKCLVFDDSFEHETWNRSDQSRMILIVDLWHPDLTEIEKQALLKGFNTVTVKQIFYLDRLKNTTADAMFIEQLQSQFAALEKRFSL